MHTAARYYTRNYPGWRTGDRTGAGPWRPCSISLQEGQEPHTSNRAQGRLRGENVSTGDRNETCMVWSVQAGRLEKLVGNLVPAFLGGAPSNLPTFLGTYRAFPTTQQMLDLLSTSYGCILPYSDEDGGPLHQLKMSLTLGKKPVHYELLTEEVPLAWHRGRPADRGAPGS
ncbi:ral guanine nucleotide dissociation stimulator-like isoform X2 [Globicephala melas]|uniref:ral guanine nucleotide dissociation stimulator-like isoform X2 n=1 Tax=Globicephala melas TaxID=9731 RepID=UPI00293D749A|nr:ral guanine nucleotide dissociation stimulator-like isoform X2 [Globicephala melas]